MTKKTRIIRNKKLFINLMLVLVLCSILYIGLNIISNKGMKIVKDYEKNNIIQLADKNDTQKNDKELEDNIKSTGKMLNAKSTVPLDDNANAYSAEKVSEILNNKFPKDGKKIVFLTFDDGPSTTVTPKILDTLKQYDVKATFFLIGKNVESNENSKELVRRALNEGHALGNHTYTHDFKNKLYPQNKIDVDYYLKEVDKTNSAIRSAVGKNFNTRIIRMPGGYMSRVFYKDPNLDKFNTKLQEKNLISIDWNAYDEDSESKPRNADQILAAVKRYVGDQEKVVLLMHDTYGKEETAKALPKIIEYLKSQAYNFKTIK